VINLKKLIAKRENKRIFSNFMSLSFLQGASLVFPLITFPYLVRTLGIDKYGLIMFAQAFMAYFSLLADYGFNLSGTRDVSLHKDNSQKLTSLYNSILFARLGLTVLGFIIMSVVVFSIEKFTMDWELYFLSYGIIIGTAIFPTWFFQGMEKMKFITILSTLSKLAFTTLIFVFVNSPQDYLWVPLLNTGGSILVGLIALVIINRYFKVPFKAQKLSDVFQQLQKGWYIFISKISTNLYTATTTFVLGLAVNTTVVGYYVIAEKVIRIITTLFLPFTQAIYPNIVKLVNKSRAEAISLLSKILKYTLILTLGILLVGVIFTEPIFYLVFGDDVDNSIILFRVLSPLIVILPIAAILFNITLLPFNMDKYFFKIYATGAALNIFLLAIFIFIMELSTVGGAVSLLICEFSITLYAAILLHRKNIKLFSFFKKKQLVIK
jgi:polysaccharide transporter, PST family